MKLEKKEEEKMKSYVSNFEAAYKVAKEKGLPELPHAYRMYQLLENANITDNEYMMVLTGITSNSTDLYDDAKKSLLKLFNSARNQGTQNDLSSIKHEPNGDTFWGSRTNNGKTSFVPKSGGHIPWRNPHSKQGYQPSRSVSKPINPTKDGKQLLCNSCGSYRHFAKMCPDRYEGQFHQEKIQGYELEEDQYGGDGSSSQEEEIKDRHLNGLKVFDVFSNKVNDTVFHSEETIGQVLLDTGCVKSVCGLKWFNDFMDKVKLNTRKQVKKYPSQNTFRFGGV